MEQADAGLMDRPAAARVTMTGPTRREVNGRPVWRHAAGVDRYLAFDSTFKEESVHRGDVRGRPCRGGCTAQDRGDVPLIITLFAAATPSTDGSGRLTRSREQWAGVAPPTAAALRHVRMRPPFEKDASYATSWRRRCTRSFWCAASVTTRTHQGAHCIGRG